MDTNKIAKNSLVTFVSRIGTFTVNLLTTILYSRALGPSDLGLFVQFTLIPIFLLTFIIPPIGLANVYFGGEEDKAKDLKVISLFLSFLILILTLLFVLLLRNNIWNLLAWFPLSIRNSLHLTLALSHLPAQASFQFFLRILQGQRKFTIYNIIFLMPILFFFLGALAFQIMQDLNLTTLLISSLVANSIAAIVAIGICIYDVGPIRQINFNLMHQSIKYSLKAYFWNISLLMDKKLDVFFAAAILTTEQLGFYATAVSIIDKLWALPDSISTVFFPTVSSNKNKDIQNIASDENINVTSLIVRQTIFILTVTSILVFIFAKPIILILYGGAFLESVFLLRILLLGGISMGASRVLAADYAGNGEPQIGAIATIVSSVSLIFIALVLALVMDQAVGMALSNTIGYTLGFLVLASLFARKTKVPFEKILTPNDDDKRIYESIYKKLLNLVAIARH